MARVRVVGLGGVVLIAMTVLAGWALDIPSLTRFVPGTVAMNPLTAVAFLACAAALELLVRSPTDPRIRTAAGILAGFVLTISLLRVLGYIGGFDPVLDRILFARSLDAGLEPNRMAPNTAFNFLLLAISLLFLTTSKPRLVSLAQSICLGATVIAMFALTGYAYQDVGLARVALQIPMAPHTALGFVLLSTALIAAYIDRGPLRILTSPTVGGRIARLLMPAAVVVPVGLGWLRLQGEKAGWYGMEIGVALMAVSTTMLFIVLIWWTAREIEVVDVVRRRTEDRVRELNESLAVRARLLETANMELEAFSYSVSHDLRSPLRSLDGFSQALAEDYGEQLDDQGRDFLRRIRAAAQRMGRLIDDLLGLARVARIEIKAVPVDLTAMAKSIGAELEQQHPDHSVTLDVAAELSTIGDPGLLRIVLENLLGNAWKFTGSQERARIEFGTEMVDGERAFVVRDDGAGFDMAYAHKLFAPFQRLHAMTEFPGTGVGLATVQRIILRHGGRIWVDAAVGRGATFFFTVGVNNNGNHHSAGRG